MSSPEELLASIGSGRINVNQVVQKLTGQEDTDRRRLPKTRPKPRRDTARGVTVKGVDNVLVRFSKCCNPVPGDDIIGYITRGRGISVHRADCPNAANLIKEAGRQIEVSWNADEADSYPVEIEIEAMDRPNLLTSIMNALSASKTGVEAINARTVKHESATVQLVLEIRDVDHLGHVMRTLEQVNGVLHVYRASPT